MPNDNDLTPSEQTPESNYLQVERNKSFPPPFIMDLMMGVSPQRRRAYLLQNQYLTPLTFEYMVLSFFFRYVLLCVACSFLLVLWLVVGYANPLIYLLSIVSFISIYIGYQWSVTKNTNTVKEEVLYNSIVNALAAFFAIYTIVDLRSFFIWLISSPIK